MSYYKNSYNARNPLNVALAAAGVAERVVQGNGYVYFVEGDAAGWFSSSIPVCWMRDLTAEEVIAWRNELANDYRNA